MNWQIWQIWVGPAVGLAGLLFAIYVYNKNRKPKRLQYEIRTDQEIVSQSRHTRWADLTVRFRDRDLKRPRLVVIRVTNTGKVEARADDFDDPLAVSATEGAEIIAATIALRQNDMGESREIEPARQGATEVVAPKTLLNEGEWLEFRLLVDGDKKPVHLRGRAAGFNLASSAPRRRLLRSPISSAAFVVVVVVIVATFAGVTLSFLSLATSTVPVPNLVGKPVQQAVTQINDSGLKLGTVNRVRSSTPASLVMSQSPAAGKKADKESVITLLVSDGP